MEHPISFRRPDFVIVNKKKIIFQLVYFAVLADHRVKLKKSKIIKINKKQNKHPNLVKELEITMEDEGDCDTNNSQSQWNHSKECGNKTERTREIHFTNKWNKKMAILFTVFNTIIGTREISVHNKEYLLKNTKRIKRRNSFGLFTIHG